MRLKSLALKNVRSYGKCDVEFGDGTTLLIGDIGCGKSSILMAIEFALFGLGSSKSDALVSKGSGSCSVTLGFESDGKEYVIHRTLRISDNGKAAHDSKNTWIETDGVRDETLAASDLKKKVINILGIDEPKGAGAGGSIFRYAVYTPQEEMKAVLADPDKRKETIRRAFGIDGFKVARDNAKTVSGAIRGIMKEHAARFEGMDSILKRCKELDAELEETKDGVMLLEKEKTACEAKTKECVENCAGLEKTTAEASEAFAKFGPLAERAEEIRGKTKRSKAELSELESVLEADAPEKPDTTLKALEEETRRLRPGMDDLIRARSKMEDARHETEQIGNPKSDFYSPTTHAAISKKLRAARNEREEASEKLNIMRGMLKAEKIVSGEGDCALCGQYVSKELAAKRKHDGEAEARKARKDMGSLEKKLGIIDGTVSRLEKSVDTMEEKQKLHEKAREDAARLAKKTVEIKGLQKTVSELEPTEEILRNLEKKRGAVVEYEEFTAGRREAIIKRDGIREVLAGLVGELSQIKKSMEGAAGVKNRLDALRQELDGSREELSRLRGAAAGVGESLAAGREAAKRLGTSLKENEERLKECEAWMEKHGRLGRHADWLAKIFVPSVQTMEEQVMARTRSRFARLYGEFYDMLIDDQSKESTIDADFTPTVTEGGHDQAVGNLSGGEKTSVALAYRLTLARMVRDDAGVMGDGLLMLDEPTDGFSKSQLQKVREVLNAAGAGQVILVSHDAELESYADRIYRVEKIGGKSAVSVG